jgi:sentrin-specific protease 7
MKDAARAAKRVPEPEKVQIFKRNLLFIPMCDNLHWTLAVICNLPQLKKRVSESLIQGKRLEYKKEFHSEQESPFMFICDSLVSKDKTRLKEIVEVIREYLSLRLEIEKVQEIQAARESNSHEEQLHFKLKAADIPLRRSIVPQQNNTCDCGVYMLEYTERILTQYFPKADVDENVHIIDDDSNIELPIRNAKWFNGSAIVAKRKKIKQIIESKIEEQGSIHPSLLTDTHTSSIEMLSHDPTEHSK